MFFQPPLKSVLLIVLHWIWESFFGLFILRVVELKIPINTICYIGSINTILKFNNSFFSYFSRSRPRPPRWCWLVTFKNHFGQFNKIFLTCFYPHEFLWNQTFVQIFHEIFSWGQHVSGTGLATTKYPVPIHLKLVEVVTFFFCDWLTNLLDRNWATKCVFSIDFCNKSDFNSMNFSRESRCYFPGIESREYWQFPGNSRPGNSREETLATTLYMILFNIDVFLPYQSVQLETCYFVVS